MNAHALKPPSRLLFALELRALPELGGFLASLPALTALAPRGDGHSVLVLPGLVTSDRSTVPLRTTEGVSPVTSINTSTTAALHRAARRCRRSGCA